MSKPKPAYKRVVLKLSGEALAGERKYGIDQEVLESIASQIKELIEHDVRSPIVGGNIWQALLPGRRVWTGPRRITWGCWLR